MNSLISPGTWLAQSALMLAAFGGIEAPRAHAQPVTYQVDPGQSSLILSASFGGSYGWGQFTITNQVPGSLNDCLAGTIVATADGNGGLTFAGGSAITALLNPASPSRNLAQPSFHPTGSDPNRTWSGLDNFGALCFLYDTAPIHLAYRNLVLDITAGRATIDGAPASAMRLGFVAGQRDWSQPTVLVAGDSQPPASWPIASGTNLSPKMVTLSADGSRLTIPIVLMTRSYDLGGIVTFDEIWTGTIVATTTPGDPPPPPHLALSASGPGGLQFSASGATPTHFNGINTAPWVEGSWVGAASARYSVTITNAPTGAAGFQTYVWWVGNPAGYHVEEFSGTGNPNVVRLILESDGHGRANASLGYRVNAPDNTTAFDGPGLLGRLSGAPLAGTWTVDVSDNRLFQLTAPNGAQVSGAMAASDFSNFSEKVRFYLGVNPNGIANLGQHITVSRASIDISRPTGQSTSLVGDFTSGGPLRKDWTILAADPAAVFMAPIGSRFRLAWPMVCQTTPGAGSLDYLVSFFDEFGDPATWAPFPATPKLLADGSYVVHVTETAAGADTGFFRLHLP